MVLTRAECERRIRERSKQAALKIAKQRAKECEEREAAARRKTVAKDLSGQIQRANAKPWTDRSARVEHRQRSSPSGARIATRNDNATGVGRRNVAGYSGLRQGEAAARQVLPSDGYRRHEGTLAFMARQRRRASLEVREKEEEKQQKAENLRLALKNIEQTRQRAMSHRPLRPRSRRSIQRSSGVGDNTVEVGRSTGGGIPREAWGLRRARAPSTARELEAPPARSNTRGVTRGGKTRSRGTKRASARRMPSDRPEAIVRHPPSRESHERGMLRGETGNEDDVTQRGWQQAIDWTYGEGDGFEHCEAVMQRSRVATLQGDDDAGRFGRVRDGDPREAWEDSARRETGAVGEEGWDRHDGDSGVGYGTGGAAGVQRNTSFEEKLPYILASLEKTALTVLDLQRRCARLSDVIDGPRAVPPPRRPRPREEEDVSCAPSLDVLDGTEEARKRPSPRSSVRIDQPKNDLSSRPAIAVPIPVVLPPREPAPLLQPLTPSPIVAQPCSSPVLSIEFSSTGQAPLSSGSTTTNDAELTCQSAPESSSEMTQPGHPKFPPWPTKKMPASVLPRPVATATSSTISQQTFPRDRLEHSIVPAPTPHPTSGDNGGFTYEREVGIPSADADRDASRGAFAPRRCYRKQPSELSDEEVSSTGSVATGPKRGFASWESSSLVSLVAGDILRARPPKETERQQQEKEAAAAAASAATRRERDEASAALDAAVEEAVLASAKEVAEKELEAEENRRGMLTMSEEKSLSMEGAPPDGGSRYSTAASSVLIDPPREPEISRAAISENNDKDTVLGDTSEQTSTHRRRGCDERSLRLASRETHDGDGRGEGISVDAQQREDANPMDSVVWNKLAPAELQAQLMNELRLHDDLQDAELRMDRLMAAQQVEEARQEARFAGMLLHRQRRAEEQEDIQLAQQQEFEDALARNDAIHEARLRRAKTHADERFARSAEATTTAVAAAAVASFGAQGRQAEAAIAGVEAASAHAQHQQASAMAAQTAMFMAIQRDDRLGSNAFDEVSNRGDRDTGIGVEVAWHSGLSRDDTDWRMDKRASKGSGQSTNAAHSPIDQSMASGKRPYGNRGVSKFDSSSIPKEAKQDSTTEAFAVDQPRDGQDGPRHLFDDFISVGGPGRQRPQPLCSKLGGDVGTSKGVEEAMAGGRDLAARDEDALVDFRTVERQCWPRQQLQSPLSMEHMEWLSDYDANGRSFRAGAITSSPPPPALAADGGKEGQGARGRERALQAVAGDRDLAALDEDALVDPRMAARQLSDRRQRPSPMSTEPLGRLKDPAAGGERPTSARGEGSGGNGRAASMESATVTEPEPSDLYLMEEHALAEDEVKLTTLEEHIITATCPRTQDAVEQGTPLLPLIENVPPSWPGEQQLCSSPENDGHVRSEAKISSQFPPVLPAAPGKDGEGARRSDNQISPRVQATEHQVRSDNGVVCTNARAASQSPDGKVIHDTEKGGERSVSRALTADEQRGRNGGTICPDARIPLQQPFMLAAEDGKIGQDPGWDDSRSFLYGLAGDELLTDSESDDGDVHLVSKRGKGTLHADDKYDVTCRVAEDILEELVSDTMRECERLCSR